MQLNDTARTGAAISEGATILTLEPFRDVERTGLLFNALSAEPWLHLQTAAPLPEGRWIRVTYRSRFLDPLIRPVLRWNPEAGSPDQYLPGALHGRGVWYGYVPHGAGKALISPVARAGVFGFAIDSFEILPNASLISRAVRGSLLRVAASLIARARGMGPEAIEQLSYAVCHERLVSYDSWRRHRLRPFERDGIDAPRIDWSAAPHIRLAIAVRSDSASALEKILGALEAQPYPNWSIALVTREVIAFSPALQTAQENGRLILADGEGAAGTLAAGLRSDALIGRRRLQDETPASALPILAEFAVDHPELNLFYGDEDIRDRDGVYRSPRLKPDWSPVFQSQTDYVGAAVFARAGLLLKSHATAASLANPDTSLDQIVAQDDVRIGHIRRILLSRATGPVQALPQKNVAVSASAGSGRTTSIIIPIRDKVELLIACVNSIVANSADEPFEVIVVDNGSVEEKTTAYLKQLECDGRFRILRRPIPFNFSQLCNDGAEIASGDTYVFLNNDTEVISQNWLAPLLDLTSQEKIGAVGPKLLFKSGSLQHAGVVVGLFGRADHIFGGAHPADRGYLDQISVVREVSAVTGACLAVAKSKFQSVGGFDAVNLPVDLNDIDLCLRLAEKGFANIYTPESVLFHYESATRGMYAQPSKKYARERAYFTKRWNSAMRDDPKFHPALSRHALNPSLG